MVTRETSILSALRVLGLSDVVPDVALVVRRLETYAGLLERVALPRGLIGPGEVPKMLGRHIAEALTLATIFRDGGRIVDVGSGAGLPGLVIAAMGVYDLVLIEPIARRAAFLRRAAHEMELVVEIVAGPAETVGRSGLRESAAGVVARAVAPPEVALELVLPFAQVGGVTVLPVGAGQLAAVQASGAVREAARTLGGSDPAFSRLEVPGAEEALWVMIVRKARTTPEGYPRRPGIPRRRPLGGRVTDVG